MALKSLVTKSIKMRREIMKICQLFKSYEPKHLGFGALALSKHVRNIIFTNMVNLIMISF